MNEIRYSLRVRTRLQELRAIDEHDSGEEDFGEDEFTESDADNDSESENEANDNDTEDDDDCHPPLSQTIEFIHNESSEAEQNLSLHQPLLTI